MKKGLGNKRVDIDIDALMEANLHGEKKEQKAEMKVEDVVFKHHASPSAEQVAEEVTPTSEIENVPEMEKVEELEEVVEAPVEDIPAAPEAESIADIETAPQIEEAVVEQVSEVPEPTQPIVEEEESVEEAPQEMLEEEVKTPMDEPVAFTEPVVEEPIEVAPQIEEPTSELEQEPQPEPTVDYTPEPVVEEEPEIIQEPIQEETQEPVMTAQEPIQDTTMNTETPKHTTQSPFAASQQSAQNIHADDSASTICRGDVGTETKNLDDSGENLKHLEHAITLLHDDLEGVRGAGHVLAELQHAVSDMQGKLTELTNKKADGGEEHAFAISHLASKTTVFAVSLIFSVVTAILVIIAIAVVPEMYPDLPETLTSILGM